MKIAVVTGAGNIGGIDYGSGHFERMSELRRRLEQRGDAVELVPPDAPPPRADLCIVDARDHDPRPYQTPRRPVLALDNRHPQRQASIAGGVNFYDTIPHPEADLAGTLRQALLAADVLECKSSYKREPGRVPFRIFCYSGGFSDVDALDDWLARAAGRGWEVRRCGTAKPSTAFLKSGGRHVERAPRRDFLAHLAAADCIVSYFGMTILEAWYLRRLPVLYETGSTIHEELGSYLADAAGLPHLHVRSMTPAQQERSLDALAGGEWPLPPAGPGGNGYDLLMEEIDRLCG